MDTRGIDRSLHNELLLCTRARVERDRLLRRRQGLLTSLAEHRLRLQTLDNIVAKEQRDVDNMADALSGSKLWALLMNADPAKLERERFEAGQARMRRDQQAQIIGETEAELGATETRLTELAEMDARYDAAVAACRQALVRAEDPRAATFDAIVGEVRSTQGWLEEIRQAVEAGDAAQAWLRPAILEVKRLDRQLVVQRHQRKTGGHLTVPAYEQTAGALRNGQLALNRFATEAHQVQQGLRIGVEMRSVHGAADDLLQAVLSRRVESDAAQRGLLRLERLQQYLATTATILRQTWDRLDARRRQAEHTLTEVLHA